MRQPQPHPILRPMHPPIRPEQRLWRWFRSLYPLSQAGLGCLVLLLVFFLCSLCATPDARQGFAQGLKPMIDAWNNVHQSTATPTVDTTPAPMWTTIGTFTGVGTSKTGIFTVTGDWELNWSCTPTSSSSFTIDVDSPGANTPAIPGAVDTICSTDVYGGTIDEHQTGTFSLAVTSSTQWTIEIVQSI